MTDAELALHCISQLSSHRADDYGSWVRVGMALRNAGCNLSDWESWTEMKFPQSGEFYIPGALNPVSMDVEADRGVYLEPNVWIYHSLE